MSVIKANGAGEQSTGFYGHTIDQSLRFNDADSAYLHRATSGTPSSTTSTVFSCWVKRSNLGAIQNIWTAATTAPSVCGYVYFNASDQIQIYLDKSAGGSDELNTTTTAVFRDVSSWYHIAVVYNTADSTTANKSKIYVNGVQQAVSTSVTGSAVTTHRLLDNAVVNTIGKSFNSNYYFDGYLAELHVVDGVAGIDYDDFGETQDGIWVAKNYSGGHGNNGFYLPFDDSSAIGDDESSNTNDFTVVNLAATDVVLDSPTNNFCTLNFLDNISTTYSEGNLAIAQSSYHYNSRGTTAVTSGKWYWEIRMSSTHGEFGVCENGKAGQLDPQANIGFNFIYNNGSAGVSYKNATAGTQSTGSISMTHWSADDICQIAYDGDNGILYHGLNGTYQTSGNPAAGSGGLITGIAPQFKGTMVPFFGQGTDNARTFVVNFGQDSSFAGTETAQGNADGNGVGDFYYAPPSGFLALCSKNLPDPEIIDGTEHFDTSLWTGNGSDRSITGLNFSPDWVWTKSRNVANSHYLFDSVRGVNQALKSDSKDGESTQADSLESFTSDGYTLGTNNNVNVAGGYTFVGWSWLAGTAFSNDASATSVGSLDSSGQVNTKAGFSIVAFNFVSSGNQTIAHGLSVAPEFIILKSRSSSDTNWWIYYGDNTDYITLNNTSATDDNAGLWNDTSPTATVFSIGSIMTSGNYGTSHIAYCFHSVDGYSKVGHFRGNNNANGTFVYTGFRPAWVLIRNYAQAYNWMILDSTREPFNDGAVNAFIRPNLQYQEATAGIVDFLSNGFKLRNTSSDTNAASSFVYLAFAEQPFKFANAR